MPLKAKSLARHAAKHELRSHSTMAMASPVSFVKRVTNYPAVRATAERLPVSEVLRPGAPTIIHLFTG